MIFNYSMTPDIHKKIDSKTCYSTFPETPCLGVEVFYKTHFRTVEGNCRLVIDTFDSYLHFQFEQIFFHP